MPPLAAGVAMRTQSPVLCVLSVCRAVTCTVCWWGMAKARQGWEQLGSCNGGIDPP